MEAQSDMTQEHLTCLYCRGKGGGGVKSREEEVSTLWSWELVDDYLSALPE